MSEKKSQNTAKPIILAVDDTPENLDVVKGILATDYTVKAAINGKMALKIAKAQPPDLILLDIMMPEMDGYEVCRHLKANPQTAQIPVIFLTAKGQTEDEAQGLELGAADYIMKPVSPPILKARVKTHLILKQNMDDLQNANRIISNQKERMQDELNVGRDIQMSMLPRDFPAFPERSEFDIFATLKPAREVGGDLYDFFFINPEEICVVIGDVSGKGVPAALFMAVSKTLIKASATDDHFTSSIVTRTNEELSHDNPSCMFVTLFVCIINVRTGEIRYTNAGHNPPYIKRADGTIDRIDKLHGPVAGAIDGIAYGEAKAHLSKGDQLFLFTDGVTEAMNLHDELFSDLRLEDFLKTQPRESVEALVWATLEAVETFAGEADQADDITILAMRFNIEPEENAHEILELTLQNDLKEIEIINGRFDEFAEQNELPTDVGLKVNIVVDDLLANIISYAYPKDETHKIRVTFDISPSQLVIIIADDGVPFNPLAMADPDTTLSLDERDIGGLGIHLVKSMMDEVQYSRKMGSNIMRLVKRIEK